MKKIILTSTIVLYGFSLLAAQNPYTLLGNAMSGGLQTLSKGQVSSMETLRNGYTNSNPYGKNVKKMGSYIDTNEFPNEEERYSNPESMIFESEVAASVSTVKKLMKRELDDKGTWMLAELCQINERGLEDSKNDNDLVAKRAYEIVIEGECKINIDINKIKNEKINNIVKDIKLGKTQTKICNDLYFDFNKLDKIHEAISKAAYTTLLINECQKQNSLEVDNLVIEKNKFMLKNTDQGINYLDVCVGFMYEYNRAIATDNQVSRQALKIMLFKNCGVNP